MTTARDMGRWHSHSTALLLCEYGRLETNTSNGQAAANPSPQTSSRLSAHRDLRASS